mgnify:CR=1 FL=1|jgi:hypothetical protein
MLEASNRPNDRFDHEANNVSHVRAKLIRRGCFPCSRAASQMTRRIKQRRGDGDRFRTSTVFNDLETNFSKRHRLGYVCIGLFFHPLRLGRSAPFDQVIVFA